MPPKNDTVEVVDSHEYNPIEVRRSFRLLSADVICYICGLAFLDSSTVVPAFLSTLTNSSLAIGCIMAIRPLGIFLPQLWTAHYVRGRRNLKSFLMKDAAISRVAMTLFAAVLFIAQPGQKTLMLCVFMCAYAAFWFSEGVAGVPWTDLVAKTIPERLRGRLFGFTQLGGGVLALFAATFITRMLSRNGPGFPLNYALLMCTSAAFFWASWLSLLGVREPDGEPEEHEGGFLDYARSIGRMLAQHARLKRMLAIQLLMGVFGMSMPFFILYATRQAADGHAAIRTGALVGTLLLAQTVGSIILSGVSGYVSDHLGPKWAIVLSLLCGVTASILALTIHGFSIWLYGLVFFAIGGLNGSSWIGLTNFLLESVDAGERRSSIGIMNTANAPTVLFPILGGLVVQAVSYRAVFAITALALCIALVLALCIRRHRD